MRFFAFLIVLMLSVSSWALAKPVQTVLFIGDSLTAGYGVRKDEAFPALIEKELSRSSTPIKAINAGISGSVSAEADRRLKWQLKNKPSILVLALGANDALKGTPIPVIKKNLTAVIDLAQKNGVKVLLVGIKIFANFGADYASELEAMYKSLAKEKNVAFLPFLLEDVALKKELNQPDGKHPNAKGHEVVAKTVLKQLGPML